MSGWRGSVLMNMPRLLSAVTGGDFFFVGGEGSQYFLLLRFRNLEVGQGPSEFLGAFTHRIITAPKLLTCLLHNPSRT